MEEHESRKQLM